MGSLLFKSPIHLPKTLESCSDQFSKLANSGAGVRSGLAVVTGAASGIGRALALQLAATGCRVVAVDRNQNPT